MGILNRRFSSLKKGWEMVVLALFSMFFAPAFALPTPSINSAASYFDSNNVSAQQLDFKSVDLSDKELTESFLGKHWLSFLICDSKKIPNYPEEMGKLTDRFQDNQLTQWRYPKYEQRVLAGISSFPYFMQIAKYPSLVNGEPTTTLFLSFSMGMNDQLVIQPYILQQTGELVFLYLDNFVRGGDKTCRGGQFLSIYVTPPDA